MEIKDIKGEKFGRLTAVERAGKQGRHVLWRFKCECGNEIIALGINVRSGKTKSCGCIRNENGREQLTTHGLSKTALYNTWKCMRQRCNNPNNKSYPNYGGRGIKICKEWDSFPVFFDWALTHGYKVGLQIDRIDNNGGYTPENCRWTDEKTQSNNRRTNTIIQCFGEQHTLAEWSNITRLKPSTIIQRVKRQGWTIEKALSTPVSKIN